MDARRLQEFRDPLAVLRLHGSPECLRAAEARETCLWRAGVISVSSFASNPM